MCIISREPSSPPSLQIPTQKRHRLPRTSAGRGKSQTRSGGSERGGVVLDAVDLLFFACLWSKIFPSGKWCSRFSTFQPIWNSGLKYQTAQCLTTISSTYLQNKSGTRKSSGLRRKVGQSAGTPLLLRYRRARSEGGEISFGLTDNEERKLDMNEIPELRWI